MADEDFGHVVEMAALLPAAFLLDVLELLDGFLELAGEARAVEAKPGEQRDLGLGVGGLGEQVGFEEWNAVETPGGVGDFVDQLCFGGVGGFVLVEKLLGVALEGLGVLRGQDGGARSKTVAESVLRRALFAGFGPRAGGVARSLRGLRARGARFSTPGWGQELLRASQRRTGSVSAGVVGVSGAWAVVAIGILGHWDSMARDAADRGPAWFVAGEAERMGGSL